VGTVFFLGGDFLEFESVNHGWHEPSKMCQSSFLIDTSCYLRRSSSIEAEQLQF
jgi:hypothetical protein